jgi:hypothetical protein
LPSPAALGVLLANLLQFLYSVTITADGVVPVHCKIYDGNTTE